MKLSLLARCSVFLLVPLFLMATVHESEPAVGTEGFSTVDESYHLDLNLHDEDSPLEVGAYPLEEESLAYTSIPEARHGIAFFAVVAALIVLFRGQRPFSRL